jgi:2-polyprenyl-3-methyl-5-hydroxy-6-metoxy-1,4-benzoquinol methylase
MATSDMTSTTKQPGTGEKSLQDALPWTRSGEYATYNTILGEYMVRTALEYACGDSLLDLACGDGLLTAQFRPHFRRVVGVDASGAHLHQARLRCPDVEFHESLIEDFRPAERFGTVVLFNILEHVQDPAEFLRHVAEFVAPGGVLFITVPNAEAINRRLAVRMGTLVSADELSPYDIKVAGHRRSYTLQSLSADIEAGSLAIKDSGGIFYKMLSMSQMDWFLKNGLWDSGFGWGRTGEETTRDWRAEFCRASYELGREQPQDCNLIFACVTPSTS